MINKKYNCKKDGDKFKEIVAGNQPTIFRIFRITFECDMTEYRYILDNFEGTGSVRIVKEEMKIED